MSYMYATSYYLIAGWSPADSNRVSDFCRTRHDLVCVRRSGAQTGVRFLGCSPDRCSGKIIPILAYIVYFDKPQTAKLNYRYRWELVLRMKYVWLIKKLKSGPLYVLLSTYGLIFFNILVLRMN